jgi:hypothetical protein
MAQKFNVADLTVTSPSFDEHGQIPKRFTGDGDDVSPAIEWSGVPEGTQSFAVVVHDPDAPLVDGFTHWVLYDIPADARSLEEGTHEYVSGLNTLGNDAYMGPGPPPGHGSHHYYVWVYALDANLDLPPKLARRQLLDLIEDHVIEQARAVGIYER